MTARARPAPNPRRAHRADRSETPNRSSEVIIPDVLNTYDVVVWAEESSHSVLTQRKDESGATRMLIKP